MEKGNQYQGGVVKDSGAMPLQNHLQSDSENEEHQCTAQPFAQQKVWSQIVKV